MRVFFGFLAVASIVLPLATAQAATTSIKFTDASGNYLFPDGTASLSVGLNNHTDSVFGDGGLGYSTFSTPPPGEVSTNLFWCDDFPSSLLTTTNTYVITQVTSGFVATGGSVTIGQSNAATVNQLTNLVANGQAYLANHVSGTNSAALQVAIWAMLYNGANSWANITTNSGTNFYANSSGTASGVIATAQIFLGCALGTVDASICSSGWTADLSGTYALNNFKPVDANGNEIAGQDMLRLAQIGTTTTQVTTPEPASMALFAVGLAGLGAARRQRARRG